MQQKEAQALLQPGQWIEKVGMGTYSWYIFGTPTPQAEPEPEPVDVDYGIFAQQGSTLETLQEILDRQDYPVYVSPPAPRPRPDNYLMYIGIGIGILFLTGRLKL